MHHHRWNCDPDPTSHETAGSSLVSTQDSSFGVTATAGAASVRQLPSHAAIGTLPLEVTVTDIGFALIVK